MCNIRRKKLWTNTGFTLIELLVVLAILGFFVAMAAKVFTKGDDQRRFEETRIRMEEIKKAILGSPGAYANGQRQFAGYVADTGGLPDLVDEDGNIIPNGQPKGLWTRDLNNDGDPNIGATDIPDTAVWEYKDTPKIWMGWRGPYLEVPPRGDNMLRDGWGNPFIIFRDSLPVDICGDISAKITAMGGMQPGDMAIISLGADNACGETDIFDENIIIIVRQTEYMAPVAGKVKNFGTFGGVIVQLYYPAGDTNPFLG